MTQFAALSVSLIIEVPIVLFLLRQFSSLRFYWLIILACGATMLTHPMAWEFNQILIPYTSFLIRSIFIESFVILAEAVLYWIVLKLHWRDGLFISIVANIVSFLFGMMI
jgi:hypothetical protein